jgi:hypothetical protein
MATKQSRALRAKQKAKAARVQKQKAYAQPRYEQLSEQIIEVFDSLPIPDVSALAANTPPIAFLSPLIQAFLPDYPREEVNEDNHALIDTILLLAGMYLYWGATESPIVPVDEVEKRALLVKAVPETLPLIKAEIRQFLAVRT